MAKTLLMAVVAIVASGGATWYFLHQSTDAASSARDKPSISLVHLDGFTVNLADAEENHFLRVSMDLAVERIPPPVERDKPNSGLPMPEIRDSILSVLTTCKADRLLTPEGKEKLKKDLREMLNRSNPELGVREIYFTEFLVQR